MRIQKIGITAVSLAMLLVVQQASAGKIFGTINTVKVQDDGQVIFNLAANKKKFSDCNKKGNFYIDTNTASGKNMYEALIVGYSKGGFVNIFPADTCNGASGAQGVTAIMLGHPREDGISKDNLPEEIGDSLK